METHQIVALVGIFYLLGCASGIFIHQSFVGDLKKIDKEITEKLKEYTLGRGDKNV